MFRKIPDSGCKGVALIFSHSQVAAQSRWTNVGSAQRRFMLLLASGQVLVSAMKSVKTHWKLSADLVSSLQREIEADQNCFPARNKLRLLRIVETFCEERTTERMGISIVAMEVIDRVLYAVLGGPRRPRVSLGMLADPIKSPIVTCQRELLHLLQHFSDQERPEVPGPTWWLLSRCGCDYGDVWLRLAARRALLQLSAAMTDFFEMRMEKPPYRLCWILCDEVPEAARRRVVNDFYREPAGCLPLLCLRLRQAFASPEAFLAGAGEALRCWSQGTFASIDFSERSHSQFRHDVASHTTGADFRATSNRLFVRQFVAAHTAAGGVDPCTRGALEILQEAGVETGSRARGKPKGCSSYIEFSNNKRKAIKALVAPGRPLTCTERQNMESQVKTEWAQVRDDPAQLQLWQSVAKNKVTRASSQQQVVALADAAERPFASPCGVSRDRNHLIEPAALVAAIKPPGSAQQHEAEDSVPATDPLYVRAPVQNRTAGVGQGHKLMFGCYTSHKNICREHGCGSNRAAELDTIVGLLKKWVGTLTPGQSDGCSELVGFIGKNPGDESCILVVELLVLVRKKPKMQFFADCCGFGEMGRTMQYPLDYPQKIIICDRLSRLAVGTVDGGGGEARRGVCISTSDELGTFLLSLKSEWKMVGLKYDLDMSTSSLLRMDITGHGEEIDAATCHRARVQRLPRPLNIPAEFNMGDPFAVGRAQAASACQLAAPLQAAPASDLAESDSSGEDAYVEDFALEDIDPDTAGDIFELIAEARQLPPESEAARASVDSGEDPHAAAAEAVAVDEEIEAHAMEEEGAEASALADEELIEAPAEAAEAPHPSAEQCVEAAEIDDEGKVFCPLGKFAQYRPVGRITHWGAPGNLNVGIRCSLHVSCSYSRKRSKFTNQQLLRWLFSGKLWEPGLVDADLKRDHAIKAVAML